MNFWLVVYYTICFVFFGNMTLHSLIFLKKLCIQINFKLLTLCYYHVMYAFQSEFTLYNSLNVKELLAWYWYDIWNLSDSIGIRIHKHLVRKRLLNHLANLGSLGKWLCVRLRTKWLWIHFPLPSYFWLFQRKVNFTV